MSKARHNWFPIEVWPPFHLHHPLPWHHLWHFQLLETSQLFEQPHPPYLPLVQHRHPDKHKWHHSLCGPKFYFRNSHYSPDHLPPTLRPGQFQPNGYQPWSPHSLLEFYWFEFPQSHQHHLKFGKHKEHHSWLPNVVLLQLQHLYLLCLPSCHHQQQHQLWYFCHLLQSCPMFLALPQPLCHHEWHRVHRSWLPILVLM